MSEFSELLDAAMKLRVPDSTLTPNREVSNLRDSTGFESDY
jgi:hypothetical protein